ncbi:aldehyde dehydrogenase family protein [Escherichia coli]
MAGLGSRRRAGPSPAERERILPRPADLEEQHSQELAQPETLEQGKSIAISRAFKWAVRQNRMRYTAGLTTKSRVKRRTCRSPYRGALSGSYAKRAGPA